MISVLIGPPDCPIFMQCKLILDANEGYTPGEALDVLRLLQGEVSSCASFLLYKIVRRGCDSGIFSKKSIFLRSVFSKGGVSGRVRSDVKSDTRHRLAPFLSPILTSANDDVISVRRPNTSLIQLMVAAYVVSPRPL